MEIIEGIDVNSHTPVFVNQRAYSGERSTKIRKAPSRSMSPKVGHSLQFSIMNSLVLRKLGYSFIILLLNRSFRW